MARQMQGVFSSSSLIDPSIEKIHGNLVFPLKGGCTNSGGIASAIIVSFVSWMTDALPLLLYMSGIEVLSTRQKTDLYPLKALTANGKELTKGTGYANPAPRGGPQESRIPIFRPLSVRATHRQFSPSVDGLPRGHVFVFRVIAKNAIFFPPEGL